MTRIPPRNAGARVADETTSMMPRYLSLDALRGMAVMGILAMNIIGFSMPELAYFNPRVWGGSSALDVFAWAIAFIAIDGKMRGLFSLLFGASMLIVARAAEARGTSGTHVHFHRMAWLLIFGLAHYYLIWFGDILTLYAMVGTVAFTARRGDADQLIRWSVLAFITNFFIWTFIAVSILMTAGAATAPGASPAAIASYQTMIAGFGTAGGAHTAAELAIYAGSYSDIVSYRIGDRLNGPLLTILTSGLETLGLMLLGMGLLKNGFLSGSWTRPRYRKLAVLCSLLGFPPMAMLALWSMTSGFDPVINFNAVFVWSLPFRILLVIAYAAAALWAIDRFSRSAAIAWIAAAGRVAFTNYIGTSIVMTTIFYGYGLGYYGTISRAGSYVFVAAGCVLMLLWSKPWLDRFAYGPLEWAWRSLASGRLEKMRVRQNDP